MELFSNKEILLAINFDIICQSIYNTMDNSENNADATCSTVVRDSGILVSDSENSTTNINEEQTYLKSLDGFSIPILNDSAGTHSPCDPVSTTGPSLDKTSDDVSGEIKEHSGNVNETNSELKDTDQVNSQDNSECVSGPKTNDHTTCSTAVSFTTQSTVNLSSADVLVDNSCNVKNNTTPTCNDVHLKELPTCSDIGDAPADLISVAVPPLDRTSVIVSAEKKEHSSNVNETKGKLKDTEQVHNHDNSEFVSGPLTTNHATCSIDISLTAQSTVNMSSTDVLVDNSCNLKNNSTQNDIHLNALLSDKHHAPTDEENSNNDKAMKYTCLKTLLACKLPVPNDDGNSNYNDIAKKQSLLTALLNSKGYVPTGEGNGVNDMLVTENDNRSVGSDSDKGGNDSTGFQTPSILFETDKMMDYESDSERDAIGVEVLLNESKVNCINTISNTSGSYSSTLISVKCEDRGNNTPVVGEEIRASDKPVLQHKSGKELSTNTKTAHDKNPSAYMTSACSKTTCQPNSPKAASSTLVSTINTSSASHGVLSSFECDSNINELNTDKEWSKSENSVHRPSPFGSESRVIDDVKGIQSTEQLRDKVDVHSVSSCHEPSNRKKNEDIFHVSSKYNAHSTECIKKPHIAVVFPLKDNTEERQATTQAHEETSPDKYESITDFIEKYITHQPKSEQNMPLSMNTPARSEIAQVQKNNTVISADDITCCDELWANLLSENPLSSLEDKQVHNKNIKSDESNSDLCMTPKSADIHSEYPSAAKRRPPKDVNQPQTIQSSVFGNNLNNKDTYHDLRQGQQTATTFSGGQYVPREPQQTVNNNPDTSMIRQQLMNQFQLSAIRARAQQANLSHNTQRAVIVPQHRPSITSGFIGGNQMHTFNQSTTGVSQPDIGISAFTQPSRSYAQQQYSQQTIPQHRLIRPTPMQQLTSNAGYTSVIKTNTLTVDPTMCQPQGQRQFLQTRESFSHQMPSRSLQGPTQYTQGRQQYVVSQSHVNSLPNRFNNSGNTVPNQQTVLTSNLQRFLHTGKQNNVAANRMTLGTAPCQPPQFPGSQRYVGYAPTLAAGGVQNTQIPLPGTNKQHRMPVIMNNHMPTNVRQQRNMSPGVPAQSTQEYTADQLLDIAQQSETLPDLSWIADFNL